MFSRRSEAWFINESGKVEWSPRDTPRYESDDVPAVRGMLLEPTTDTPDKEG